MLAQTDVLGLRFQFRTEDVVGRHLYKQGVHEPEVTRFLREDVQFRAGDVVVDVGANLGWYSLLLDRILPEGAEVYAFEPDPANFALLTENLRLNGARKVTPVNMALADREGVQKLYRYAAKNLGRHSLLPIQDGETVEVRTTTLDAFWRSRGLAGRRPRLLKIDVEGFEYAALRGAEGVLKDCPIVLSEFEPELMRKGGIAPAKYLDLLRSLGLRPRRIDDDGLHEVDPESLAVGDSSMNLVWLKDGPTISARA